MPTVRCYPLHTPDPALPDHADLATYEHQLATDTGSRHRFIGGLEVGYTQYQAAYGTAFGAPVASVSPISGSSRIWAIWWQEGGPGFHDVITWEDTYADIRWDFTPLPLLAVVASSILHVRSQVQVGIPNYEANPAYFGGFTIPAQANGSTVTQDIAVGNAWVGGSQPWIRFENGLLHAAPAHIREDYPGVLGNSCQTRLILGWGHFSLGECCYIDVNYGITVTVTSVVPASAYVGDDVIVVITGTNFTGATVVSFGAGIVVNSFVVDLDTQITADISISLLALPGYRDVSVTAVFGIGTLTEGFEVLDAILVETDPATDILAHGATLNGDLTDIGVSTLVDVYFEYGVTSGVYLYTTSIQVKIATGVFHVDVTHLQNDTTYYFRAAADNGTVIVYGVELTFETITPTTPYPPIVAGTSKGGGSTRLEMKSSLPPIVVVLPLITEKMTLKANTRT